MGCHLSRSNDLSVHTRFDSTGYVRLLWESIEEENELSPCSGFWSLAKSEKVFAGSRGRTSDAHFETWSRFHQPLKAAISALLRTILCLLEDVFGTPRKGNWWPDHAMLCRPSPSKASDESTLSCSIVSRKGTQGCTTLQGCCHCWRCQCGSIQILQEAGVPRSVQLFGCRHVREMQREVNMDRPECRLQIDNSTNNQSSQLRSTKLSWLLLHGYSLMGKPPGPRIMRRLDSGATRVSVRRVKKRGKLRTALIPKVLKLCSE